MAEADKSPEKEAAAGLAGLAAAAQSASGRALPPVHLWNPPHCGDIGLRISRDGVWHYQGSPIGRAPLVKLFASILRKDLEGHVLVTPVEKVSIDVEDAPFLAVAMEARNAGTPEQSIALRTNLDDEAIAGPDHPLRFEPGASGGLKPYVRVRGDLWALATRPVYYELADLGEIERIDGKDMFGVRSQGKFFTMCLADDLAGSLGDPE